MTKVYDAIGTLFIDDVMLKLVQLAERDHKQHPSSPPSSIEQPTTPSEKQEKPSDKIQFSSEQGLKFFFLFASYRLFFKTLLRENCGCFPSIHFASTHRLWFIQITGNHETR